MASSNIVLQSLPWTGERYLPEIEGNIELEHFHRYLFAKQFLSGKRVLDIASGEGYGSALLAQTAISVIGVDISPDAVVHANMKYQANNLEFRRGSCAAIPLADHSVDVVVSFETIEHHNEHDAMMREIKRVLIPGGLLIISSPDKLEYSDKTGYDNPYHVKELYREDFISLLDTYFKNHKIAGQRVIYGSAIFEEDGLSNVRSYDLSDNSLLSAPGIRHAVYLLAVASDAELPLAESCILEQSRNDLHQQLRALGSEHDKVVAWAEDLNQAVIDRDQQLNALKSEHVKVVAWAKELNQAVIDRDQQIAGFEQTQTELYQQLHALRSEHDKVVAWANDLNQAMTEKDQKICTVQRELNHILHSRSWRLTKPLRSTIMAIRQRNRSRRLSLLRKIAGYLRIRRDIFHGVAVREILDSALFDADYYRASNQDLQNAGVDLAEHYFLHGWREKRDPSAAFSTSQYLFNNPDVARAHVNPLLHYLRYGSLEGRSIGSKTSTIEVVSNFIPVHSLSLPQQNVVEADDLPDDPDHGKIGNAAIDAEVEDIKKSGLFDESFYLSMCMDLQPAPSDAVRHYCEQGWRQGRNPSGDFDTRFYLATYSDIRNAGLNPFWHYVVAGATELRHARPDMMTLEENDAYNAMIDAEVDTIRKSGLFDESFYYSMHPDLEPLWCDAIRHYCERGWREGVNPSDDFDTRFYLATYSDIRNAGLNPFWHYVVAGASELRHAVPDLATRYEDDIWFGVVDTDIKLLAFYSSPDWVTLRSGRPMFKGHSQPSLPHDDFGFYDPGDWLVLMRQAQTAKSHGFYGFCFQIGSDLDREGLSQPIKLFLAHDDIEFYFCVQVELLLESVSETLVTSIVQAVSDRRFICIEGRPVILVTLPDDKQEAAAAVLCLRNQLAKQGISRSFLIGSWALAGEDSLRASLAFQCDAMLDLPGAPVPGETGDFLPVDKNGVDIVPYSVVASLGVERAQKVQGVAYPLYHAVTLGRDNTVQRPKRPLVYSRFHLRAYRQWLDAAINSARLANLKDRRFVFVNAWNDWNQGLFLEPDRQGGFVRVNETTRALLKIASGMGMPKVSVIVPNYNHEPFLRRRLDSIYGQTYKNIEVILLDDCSSDASRSLLDQYAADHPEITRKLYNDENSGGAFRQWAKGIKEAKGDLVWVAESDDYCDERFLEVLVRCFDDEAVLLAYAKSNFVDKNEVPIRDDFQSYLSDLECADKWCGSYVETAHNEVRSALGIKNTIPNASGVLFKRPIDMLLLVDESWLSMVVAGDWVFYLHIIRGGKIAYSTETVNFFRRYEGSAAEVTYKKSIFYREVGLASRTVAALYNVPLTVLERSRQTYLTVYENKVGGNDEEFSLWYDYQSILKACEYRLPNVMVSTMGFFPGGAEILPIRLANEFKRQGLSVLLLDAGLNPREDGIRRMLQNDVPVIETSSVEEVKAIIHDFGVEVLNTHQWHIQKYPLQVEDVFDELRGHVASLHGMIEHGDAFGVTEEQLRKADQGVTTWVYTAEKNIVPFSNFGLYDKSSSRFIKMPNGMQPPRIIPVPREDIGIPADAFVLCCVSRAIPDKGWEETILAVGFARELSGKDIRLILVGNGPVYDEYCRSGVPDFVYLVGFSENSVGHYAAANMGIMLTKFKSESFPLTIVDCLFAGKPYIASDVGDIRNMLTTMDDIAGDVIELENWEVPIERAAQIIAAFATDEKKYTNALSLVHELAKRYQIDVVASQYVRLFESSLRDE